MITVSKVFWKLITFIYFGDKPQSPISSLKYIRIIDSLIFRLSRGTANFETLVYKYVLLVKKLRYISNFNPIIIGGCPRSGTTLARALIGIHSKIASPQLECNILPMSRDVRFLMNVFEFSSHEINELNNLFKDPVSFAEKTLKMYVKKEKKQFVALKNPFHIVIVKQLFHYFPNMKFIHVIRDGRDTACSLRTFPKRKIVNNQIVPNIVRNPFEWCIRRWISCVNRGRKKGMMNDGYLEVKYEDLVLNTKTTMEKIFEFIGVEMIVIDNLLSFYKHEKEDKHLQQTIGIKKPIYKESIERWKNDMNENEKEKFKHMGGKLLVDLEYEKDLNW